MEVLEVTSRLHELGDAKLKRARQVEANSTDGQTIENRRIGVAALEDDARFCHSLADVLEGRAIDPAHSETAKQIVESICGEVKDR
jgi:hypothetical protein